MKPIRPNISKGATYPPEFREEAVRYWLSSGQTLSSVAADLGLSPQCLRNWRKSLEAGVHPTSVINCEKDSANDLALTRENGQLRRELEAMKSHGLCPRQKRRVRVRTTRSNPYLPIAPHLLLEAPPAGGSGERFYSDITYIPTEEGWLYAAATLDSYSRKYAGWSAADNMETPLVLRAAQRAMANTDARIHHSDQGSQYASELFRDFLQDNAIIQSMSRRGNCYDNGMMESFWATLKTECFDNFRSGIPATRGEVKQKLFSYIEVFYNRKQLHSALGYHSPVEFEEAYKQQNLQKEQDLSLFVST